MLSSLRWMDDVPVLSATSSDASSTALLVHCSATSSDASSTALLVHCSLSAALGIGESKRDILYVGQKCRYVKNDKDILIAAMADGRRIYIHTYSHTRHKTETRWIWTSTAEHHKSRIREEIL